MPQVAFPNITHRVAEDEIVGERLKSIVIGWASLGMREEDREGRGSWLRHTDRGLVESSWGLG